MAGVKKGLFLRIEDFARRRYGVVFATTGLLVLASTLLGTRLRLDGDILNLVPRGNRVVNTFRVALRDFGSLDYLLVLLEAPKRPKPAAARGTDAGSPSAGTAGPGDLMTEDGFVPADDGEEEDDSQAVEELQAFA